METILVLVLMVEFFGGFPISRYVLKLLKATGKATQETTTRGGTFADNLKDSVNLELNGMGELQVRGVFAAPDKELNIRPLELEVRGLFPVSNPTPGAFVTSVFDVTERNAKDGTPLLQSVIAVADVFQEPETMCFQFKQDVGVIKPNFGFPRWTKIGVVVPEFLQPPRTGSRRLKAYVRLISLDRPPEIRNGFHDDSKKILWTGTFEFPLVFSSAGWLEELENGQEATALVVKLAVAVSMADGALHDEEGERIKAWIQRKLANLDGAQRERQKAVLNAAFKEAYGECSAGTLSYSTLTEKLIEKGTVATNTECVDLVFSIVSADGVATPEEIVLANRIAAALNVHHEEVKRISDRALSGSHIVVSSHEDLESVLGIDKSWSAQQTKTYLRVEFQKWNNRLTSVREGPERESVQARLSLISKAREKYK